MLDWDDLRFFLAVARHRTLAAAARHLQVTQTTVSRRLTSLQAKMGVRLLQRASDGYGLTLAGESIRPHVERREAEALLVERTVAGHDMRPDGLVRVTGSRLLTSHVLAPSFALLHLRHQGILVEALPDLPNEPLASLDAEIALRLRRFDHPDLVVRSIGTVAFGLYGSVSYLARYGEPDLESSSPGHLFVAPLDNRNLASQTAWLADSAGRAHVVLRADSYENPTLDRLGRRRAGHAATFSSRRGTISATNRDASADTLGRDPAGHAQRESACAARAHRAGLQSRGSASARRDPQSYRTDRNAGLITAASQRQAAAACVSALTVHENAGRFHAG